MDPDLFLEICLALCFWFICLGGAVITLWTVYRVFRKLFFYMAVAPLALSTFAGPHEIGHTGSSWVRTFLCALFEMTGIMLMMRLGTILINAGGLFPTASEDILGGMFGITRMGRTSSYSWDPYYNGISIWYGCEWFEEHLDFNSRKDIAYGKHE